MNIYSNNTKLVWCDSQLPGLCDLLHAFLFIAFGNVPYCWDSVGRSTWLLIPDGTDSVLLILFGTEKTENNFKSSAKLSEYTVYYNLYKKILHCANEILHLGASLVHLLWHFTLKEMNANISKKILGTQMWISLKKILCLLTCIVCI